MRIQIPDDFEWFFSSQSAKAFCVLNARIGADSQAAPAVFFFGVARRATLPLTLPFPPTRLSELARDSPVERSVAHFLLLLETDRRELERVKNVAEVELCDPGDGFAVVTHACALGEAGPALRR